MDQMSKELKLTQKLGERLTSIQERLQKANKSAYLSTKSQHEIDLNSSHYSDIGVSGLPRTPRAREGDYVADGLVKLTKEEAFALRNQGCTPRSSISSRSNSSQSNTTPVIPKRPPAASYVKFYKYEEIKKNFKMQNIKDQMRWKLKQKIREKEKIRQHKKDKEPVHLELEYTLDPTLVQKLNQAEEKTLMTSKQNIQTSLGGIKRQRNIAVNNVADKLLSQQPVYMKPHKNKVLERQSKSNTNKFKPKALIADVHKPNCEFTSDLVVLAHQTRLVKKNKSQAKTISSGSLKEMRLKERLRLHKMALDKEQNNQQNDDEEYESDAYSFSSDGEVFSQNELRRRRNSMQYD